MSKHENLRKDKTCLNCRYVVENKFCPNCGQKNEDTRKTFHHLFVHFFEDLTHYENAFWRTIKNLLLKPASLTKEYLSGKRLSYLAPVRLYIFISFVTFFLIAVFPSKENKLISELKKSPTIDASELKKDSIAEQKQLQELLENEYIPSNIKDTIRKNAKKQKTVNDVGKVAKEIVSFGYKLSIRELDSIQKYGAEKDRLNALQYWATKKGIIISENNTNEEIIEKSVASFQYNFPKVLLIYMPFFAFFLWLFHSKKRWYYFDHGIFTLHYFSFLLLIYLIIFIFTRTLNLIVNNYITETINTIVRIACYGWAFYYFFPAHHRFYGETRWISFIKSYFLFFINMFFILIILSLFFLYTIINIH
ncbi:DUF3667 domain-containing protein [Flavobacterium sp.]|uniref:DUF3667 domain-containing protein n=1 Tax=Flavobacterium sp. TaxID=239 RepID=UPI00286E3741|nr:DUF3667 domain-containing protein [Flavobacterium sp.]